MKSTQISIRIDDELIKKIEDLAKSQKRTRNNMIQVLLDQAVDAIEKEVGK